MNDVRPRWVHYRERTGCTLVVLDAHGRVGTLMGQRGECPHSVDPLRSTWHDLDECALTSLQPPQAVDFATAYSAMRAGRTVRDGGPHLGWRWRMRGDVLEAEMSPDRYPGAFAAVGAIDPTLLTGPWYLDDGEGKVRDGE